MFDKHRSVDLLPFQCREKAFSVNWRLYVFSFDPGDFSNPNKQNALVNKVNAIINGLDLNDVCSICDAIDKLTNDILPKTDGDPNPPDWVTDPTAQQQLEDAINDIIATLQGLADSLGGC